MERHMQHILHRPRPSDLATPDNQASTASVLPVVVNGLAAIRKQTDATGWQAGKAPYHSAECPKP